MIVLKQEDLTHIAVVPKALLTMMHMDGDLVNDLVQLEGMKMETLGLIMMQEDNRIQEGLPKSIVSDHQKGVHISSSPNPMVRPVRDILGGDVPPLQVCEPPRSNGPKTPNSPLDTQASTSSSMESNEVNPAELKRANSGSLIDFSADPEPLVARATQASSAQPTTSIASNSDGGWASFDVSSQQKALEATPSKGDLESVLSQLSIQVPSSGAKPATPPTVNIHSSPEVNNNAQWATENQQLSSLPAGEYPFWVIKHAGSIYWTVSDGPCLWGVVNGSKAWLMECTAAFDGISQFVDVCKPI